MRSSSAPVDTLSDKIWDFFHHRLVIIAMSTLLIADIVCVILGISFEVEYLSSEVDDYEDLVESCREEILIPTAAGVAACDPDEVGTEFYDRAERIVFWTSITILSIFIVEGLMLFIAKPIQFVYDKRKVLDFVVVVISLTLELFFASMNAGGLIVMVRGWRFVRITHGVHEETSKDCDSCLINGKVIDQLDRLNDKGAVTKAYDDMIAGGGPETVDAELMDSILHVVGSHLKNKEQIELDLIGYVPPDVEKTSFSFTRGEQSDSYASM